MVAKKKTIFLMAICLVLTLAIVACTPQNESSEAVSEVTQIAETAPDIKGDELDCEEVVEEAEVAAPYESEVEYEEETIYEEYEPYEEEVVYEEYEQYKEEVVYEEYEQYEEEQVELQQEPIAAAPVGLSDELFSFMFSLNGVIYTLPFAYSEMAENGWVGRDLEDTLAPNYRRLNSPAELGGNTINISFANTTSNTITLAESSIGQVMFNESDARRGAEVIFPGGITVGSTKDELIEAHGEPTRIVESGSAYAIDFRLGATRDYSVVRFRIDRDTRLIREITMTNFFD